MAFQIPNSTATGDLRARPDKTDIDILALGVEGVGVVAGCAVTAQGTPNNTVAVAVGRVAARSTAAAISAGNVTIANGDATNPRWDLVVSVNGAAPSAITGTAAATPTKPALTDTNTVCLAAVRRTAGATTVTSADIVDKRVLLPAWANGDTEVAFQQTGDTYGPVRLRLQNRIGVNGAMFEQAGTPDLVDFVFKGLANQRNIRYENRSGQTRIAAPEFQIGTSDEPTLVVADTGVLVRRGTLRARQTDGATTSMPERYRTTADQTVTGTTQTTVTGLTFDVAANEVVSFQATLLVSSSATTVGIAPGVSGPASPTNLMFGATIPTATTTVQFASATAYGAIVVPTAGPGTTVVPVLVTGTIENGGTAGSVSIQIASETAPGTVTTKRGSYLILWR